MECVACNKQSVNIVSVRHSNIDVRKYEVCKKHHNIAQSDFMKFLKHIRKKK